ncbi:MAG: VWA domain-containing protein [Bacteroidetes bacterium]|nr:VWA domain-containing protein [Bacteroidota bacterium]
MIAFVHTIVLFVMLPGILPAQQFQLNMGNPDFTFYPEIQLPFEVLDNSATLDTLLAEDFMVFENGVRMVPVTIECGDLKGAQKIHFFFLMDVSYSMAFREGTTQQDWDSTKWRRAKSVFIEGFKKLRAQDEGALASFAGDFLLEQDYTMDKKLLIDAASGMYLRPGTSIYTAIVTAVNYSINKPGKRVIILLTDGVDNRSRHTREQAIDIAWQAGIPVYPIGLGFYPDQTDPSRVDQDTLRRIATGTGGKAYFAPTSDDLARIFDDIIASIYSIGCVLRYATPDTCEDGSMRDVVVQANIKGVFLEQKFTYTLPDLRSRLQVRVDIPPVLRARDVYTMPVMAEGEIRSGESLSFRMRLDYDSQHMAYEDIEAGPGIITSTDIRVTEAQPGMLLFEALNTLPSQGVAYGTPAELFTLRFRVLDHDSVALTGMNMSVDYAEQNCAMVPSARGADFTIHGCPERVTLGFDSTLATVSGGMLRVPVMLTPGVDFRQSLEYSLTLNYDQTLVTFDHIDISGTMSQEMKLNVAEFPGSLRISVPPGVPRDTSDVLFYVFFKAIETKDARLVEVSISDVSVAQSAIGLVGYNCIPAVSLYGDRMYIDGVCTPLLRLRPKPSLEQNRPNPITSGTQQTRISYTVTGIAPMQLEILDQFGRVVEVLESGLKDAGTYTATWNPTGIPSGVYLCVLREGEVVRTRNIVYTR